MSYLASILRTEKGVRIPITLEETQLAIETLEGWRVHESGSFLLEGVDGDESLVLWHDGGELWTKNPSRWALGRMIDLAALLHARVRGDEFETYETVDRSYTHPDDVGSIARSAKEGRALVKANLREQRLIRAAIVGFFIVLGILAYLVGAFLEK